MRKVCILFLIFFPFAAQAFDSVALKETISLQKKRLELPLKAQEKSQILYDLAIAYYQDQELDLAFQTFLEALSHAEKLDPVAISDEEKVFYLPALEEYLSKSGYDPYDIGESLLKKYEEIAHQHPDFHHLNFLLATAYANIGEYDRFFERFYHFYPHLTDSFLAYKTQGILYLRLSQRSHDAHEKKQFRVAAIDKFHQALSKNGQEASLYRILLLFAKEEKNELLLKEYLTKLVVNKALFSRSDIQFYVHEAVQLEEYELGQKIIDRARALYDFSRAVTEAQEYLNQNKR